MTHDLSIPDVVKSDKKSLYDYACGELKALMEGETDVTANLANATSLLHEVFGWFWVGFYVVKADVLVLAPFQGPIACTRIERGRGVCGTAWEREQTIVVEDVNEFPGHIACSSRSRSEVVVPIWVNGAVWGVLDADSESVGSFDGLDGEGLVVFCELIGKMVERCE